ncbi:MAG: hypothetical protein QM757_42055 [Paludibaculum sp.]
MSDSICWAESQNTYNGIFWVTLKDWSERKADNEQFQVIQGNLAARDFPGARCICISNHAAPRFPVSVHLVDSRLYWKTAPAAPRKNSARTCSSLSELQANGQELVGLTTTFLPSVPQLYADVDREKRPGRVCRSMMYTTRCKRLWAVISVNYFNRFGRQWQVYVAAEGEYR